MVRGTESNRGCDWPIKYFITQLTSKEQTGKWKYLEDRENKIEIIMKYHEGNEFYFEILPVITSNNTLGVYLSSYDNNKKYMAYMEDISNEWCGQVISTL